MKILVPVDGSEPSLDAVRHALHLRREGLQASFVLVTVQEPSYTYEMMLAPDAGVLEKLRAAEIVNIPFLGALAGCSARRSERRVASHTSEEQRRNAPGSAAKMGYWLFLPPLVVRSVGARSKTPKRCSRPREFPSSARSPPVIQRRRCSRLQCVTGARPSSWGRAAGVRCASRCSARCRTRCCKRQRCP